MPTYRAKPLEVDAIKLPENLTCMAIHGDEEGEKVCRWLHAHGQRWSISSHGELMLFDKQGDFYVEPGGYLVLTGPNDVTGIRADKFESLYELAD